MAGGRVEAGESFHLGEEEEARRRPAAAGGVSWSEDSPVDFPPSADLAGSGPRNLRTGILFQWKIFTIFSDLIV